MKVIIAGSRNLKNGLHVVHATVQAYAVFPKKSITEIVSGACGIDADDPNREQKKARGVDGLGEAYAIRKGIPIRRFYPSWARLGPAAGPIRNEEMARYAQALIAIPATEHPVPGSGTWDMISRAEKHGLFVYIHRIAP